MRGVGGEPALRGQRVVEPREQRVEAAGERLQLLRQSGLRASGAIASGRRLATARDIVSSGRSPRPTAYQISTPRNGISAASGSSVRSADLRGDLAPLVERVRDLQRVAAVDVRVDAPRAAVLHDVAE